MADVKIKNNTKGMGPLGVLMGRHSVKAEGKHGTGYGWTKKQAVDNYNKKSGGKKR
jgi:hypothetical protein